MPFFFYMRLILLTGTQKNTHKQVLICEICLLFLQRFFIGYWILKTGLDFYPGPFFYAYPAPLKAPGSLVKEGL